MINQTAPEDVLVIVPGVGDFLGYNPFTSRDLNVDVSRDWPLRKILEAGGVKVIEHNWPGNLRSFGDNFREAQLSLDKTINTALGISRSGKIGIIPYSGGNYISERFFEPLLSPNIRESFKAGKIHMISIGNVSHVNFGLLDSGWRNIWSRSDGFSRLSEFWSPDKYDIQVKNLSHFPYGNPWVISYIGYNMYGFRYTPASGDWNGRYNFRSTAPDDFYLQNSSGLSTNMNLQNMQRFRAPDNYYLQQNQMQSIQRIEVPRMPFMTTPRIEQPRIYTPPAQTYSPPMNNTYTPMPQHYNFK